MKVLNVLCLLLPMSRYIFLLIELALITDFMWMTFHFVYNLTATKGVVSVCSIILQCAHIQHFSFSPVTSLFINAVLKVYQYL